MTKIAVIGGADALSLEVAKELMRLGHEVVDSAQVILTPENLRATPGLDEAILAEVRNARPIRARFDHEAEPARGYGQPRKSKSHKLERAKRIAELQNGAFGKGKRR